LKIKKKKKEKIEIRPNMGGRENKALPQSSGVSRVAYVMMQNRMDRKEVLFW